MYKFRVSTISPFWAKNNENKPSKSIFEAWKNENLKEVDNIIINFLSFQNININSEFNGIKYIEIINLTDPNDTRYYYVDSFQLIGGSNTYKFNAIIDIYTSYTLNFLYDNLTTDLIFLRTHEYTKKCLQLDDSNFKEIPKIYENYSFEKINFNYDEENNIWYGNDIGISGNDLLNANKYYVFKDGVNGGYKFFPICSKAEYPIFYYQEQQKGALEYTGYFWNGRSNGSLKQDISDEINSAIVSAYENNKVIEFYHRTAQAKYIFPATVPVLGDWKKINNVPYATLPIDINAYNTSYNSAGAGLKALEININLHGNNIYYFGQNNITVAGHSRIDTVRDNAREFKVLIYENKPVFKTKEIKNSITGLEIYRRKEENINKFLGVYYLPHFLNFKNYDFEDGYVFINIDPTGGSSIGLFPIYKYNLSNIQNQLNNSTYSTPYFLKYLNIKYYGNFINPEYRISENNNIYIGGKIFFTDTANIISKSDDLIDLSKSIISYPYQLPIGVDTYEQYVKANRNVTDTSFNIEKQKQDINIASSIFGGVANFTGSAGMLAAGAVSGFPSAAAYGATQMVDSVGNTIFGVLGQINATNYISQKIKAQYQQANMTMGNSVQFSNISHASLTQYYDGLNEQFEGVEVSTISKNSLIQMNNYIYFYGYLNPQTDTLENRINNNRIFNYIQIDANLLINLVNIKYPSNKFNNEIYNLVTDQLINGVRIWNQNQDTVDIPVYNDNEEWPDQPNDTRPVITPQSPPVETPIVEIDVNHNVGIGHFNNMPVYYFDNKGVLQIGRCLIIFSINQIVQSTIISGDVQSEITKFTDKTYFDITNVLTYEQYIFAAKSGGSQRINISLRKSFWEQEKPKIILKDFTTGSSISQYTNNLIEVEAIAGINVYDKDNGEFLGEINF